MSDRPELVWVTPTQLLDLSRVESVEIVTYRSDARRGVHIHTHAGQLVKVPVPGTGADVPADANDRIAERWVVENLGAPNRRIADGGVVVDMVDNVGAPDRIGDSA